jgi:hypothetical protein
MTPKQLRVWVANNAGTLDRMVAASVAVGIGVHAVLTAPSGSTGVILLVAGVGLAWAFLSRRMRVPASAFTGLQPTLMVEGDVVEEVSDGVTHARRSFVVESVRRSSEGWLVEAVDEMGRRVSLSIDRVRLRY